MKELEKSDDPARVEDDIYAFWLNGGYFHTKADREKPYTIVMPPPNVTGQLHMGHAMDETWQDILIRFDKAHAGLRRPVGCPAPTTLPSPPRPKVVGQDEGERRA